MNIKNKIKSISLFIATIAIAVLLSLTIVDAETAAKTLTIKSTAYKKTPMTFPQTFHIKKTSSGKFVYCLTYAKKTPSNGVKYTKSSLITDNGENYILKEAYKNVNSNSDFFIYQTALWIYMSDRGLMDKIYSVNTFRTKVYNSNSKTAKKIRSIVASAKKAGKNDTSAPSIKLSSSNLKLSLDSSKKYYVSSKIKVTSSTSKYKVSFTNAPNGTKYEIKGNYLYVSVPASSIKNLSTNFKVNVSNTKTTYTSYMYKPSNKAYQKMTATYKDVKNAKDSINLNITKTVNVPVNKVDSDTGSDVKGANLTVKDASGKVIDSWTTDGKAHSVTNLSEGTYTLEETQAPNGYVLSSEKIKFTINNNGKITDEAGNEISKVVMFNKKIPTTDVEISKRDITTNNELPGANLTVKDASGKVIDSWTSTNATHKIKGLTEGKYTLTETQAPNGYVLSTETITFKVNSNGQLLNSKGNGIDKVVMYNEKQATPSKVRIVKQDATTNKNLAGATLEVKDKNNKVLATWVSTDAAYELDLTEGEYTLTETKAPNGYILNNTPIIFKVTSTGEVTDANGKIMNTIIIDNTKIPTTTKVSISKKDITNGNEVPGAKLVVKDKNSNVVDSWTSTNTPHIITGLTEGEYTLNEVIAPNGYILSNETIKFTVKADGTTTNVVMYNTPKSTTPNKPATPTNNNNNNSTGKEIEVENTGSFKNIMTSLMGILTITLGGRTIIRKTRKEN